MRTGNFSNPSWHLMLIPFALFGLSSCKPAPSSKPESPAVATDIARMTTVLIAGETTNHRFRVALAVTAEEQQRGLMFRRSLPEDGGMLFPFMPPRTASFWMKDTAIPLDMLFIQTDGTIAHIAENVEPFSRIPKTAGIPVIAVLELAGGTSAARGIRVGDQVNWGDCTTRKIALPDQFCP